MRRMVVRCALSALAVQLSACVTDTSSRVGSDCDEPGSCEAGATPTGPGQTPGSPPGTTTPDNGQPDSPGSSPSGDIPCDVQQVLAAGCDSCHGDEARFGAPMPLGSSADFQASAISDPSRLVADVVGQRIHESDPTRRMPPVGQPPLSDEQLATLDAWLAAGTPPGAACDTTQSDPLPGDEVDDPAFDVDVSCFDFLAHAPGDNDEPYDVGSARDKYVNFTFEPPWEGTAYARVMRSSIDNDQVVHHWLFYKNNSAGGEGTVTDSTGAHPGGELTHGWAPGGSDLDFRQFGDVGFEMPGDVSYTLELHYNSNDAAARDHSGIQVCVTKEPPANVATTSWLGTDLIFGNRASGTCAPTATEPIHIIGWSPHMHTKGRHMRAVLERADGSTEVLHDMPFDFNYQTLYPMDFWLMPGDRITTTCEYSEFSVFGESTDAEMCYLFTTAYPAGALSDQGPLGMAAHGANACLGL